VRGAREILRDYRERRQADVAMDASGALREENLRRLLRHVAAARQPSESLEPRLLQAMLRESRQVAAQHARRWRLFSRPAWMFVAPAAALAAAAFIVTSHPRSSQVPGWMVSLPPKHGFSSHINDQSSPAARQRPVIGLVLIGELLRRQPGEDRWESVESGTKIRLDDAVSTGPEAPGSVVFLDSSISRLLPDSAVQYTGAARGEIQRPSLVRLTRGEVWHTVEKGGPPFMVQTPSATAMVWGTEFGVAVDAKAKTTLRVKEGKVELQAAHAIVMVQAGMQSIVIPGHAPQPPSFVTPRPQPPPGGKHHPGTLPATPSAKNPPGEPGQDQNDKIFHRSPPPDVAPPAPATPTPQPAAPAGSPATTSDDGADQPQRPISTSR
jgi:hypothetical protein